MEDDRSSRYLGSSRIELPPIGLGTWAMGGLHWGGNDDGESEAAILASIHHGVTLIDTAPIYGFGHAEELLGRTLQTHGLRDQVLVATKCGLEWSDDRHQIRRNSSPKRIQQELDASLKRLRSDVIDIYQLHWPDLDVAFAETMETLLKLKQAGKIRAIGVSNFTVEQMKECLDVGARRSVPLLDASQPPYNLFERGAETEMLPFCYEQQIGTLTYGALCRGLLSGRVTKETKFPVGDLRRADPKFKADRRPQYLKAIERFKKIADRKQCTLAQVAIAWAFQQKGVSCALVGARNAKQATSNAKAIHVSMTHEDFDEIDRILAREIKTPIGPEFFAPP